MTALVTVWDTGRVAGRCISESAAWRFIFMPHQNGLDRVILGKVVFLVSAGQLARRPRCLFERNVLFAELGSG